MVPHVVILGGGFGGLYCARGLRRADVQITLVDRHNYHLFQPLLYQVATAALNPSDIAAPIRAILRRQMNVRVILGEATAVDPARKLVRLADGELTYDYLVIATGPAINLSPLRQALRSRRESPVTLAMPCSRINTPTVTRSKSFPRSSRDIQALHYVVGQEGALL